MGKYLNLSTDTTLGGNSPSDVLAVSQKAVKTYIDNNSGGSASSWTYTSHTLIYSDTTYGNKTISLSSVLPSSGSTFELLLSVYSDTGDVSNVFPLMFPVNLREIDPTLTGRTFTIYTASGRTVPKYQCIDNSVNYIQSRGGIILPVESKTMYAKMEGTNDLNFKEFKVYLDGYKVLS